MRAAKGHRCLGHLELSPEGRLDGWCWLPDRPDERAVIDIVVDGEPVQSVVATRLRPDLRDLGMGDGYCGFQVPLLARGRVAARVVEARERSIGFVFGRVLLPADPAADPGLHRLNAVSKRLAAAASSLWLAGQRVDASPAEPFGLLGQALLHRRVAPRIAASADLANGPRGASPATLESPRAVVLAACHHAIGRLPSADL